MRHYSALDFKFFITIQVDFIYNCTFLHLQDIFSKATYKRGTKAIHPGAKNIRYIQYQVFWTRIGQFPLLLKIKAFDNSFYYFLK